MLSHRIMPNVEPIVGDLNLAISKASWISSTFLIPWDDTDTRTGAFGIANHGSYYPYVGRYPNLHQRPALNYKYQTP